MRVSYEIRNADGKICEHGILMLDDVYDIVFNAMDNGHTIKIEPFYEEQDDE